MANKSTNAEISLRVNEVYGLLTRGYSRSQILQHSSEVWGVSGRMGDNYIAKARELIDADCNLSRPAFSSTKCMDDTTVQFVMPSSVRQTR